MSVSGIHLPGYLCGISYDTDVCDKRLLVTDPQHSPGIQRLTYSKHKKGKDIGRSSGSDGSMIVQLALMIYAHKMNGHNHTDQVLVTLDEQHLIAEHFPTPLNVSSLSYISSRLYHAVGPAKGHEQAQ